MFCDNKIPHEDKAVIPLIVFDSKIVAVGVGLYANGNNYVACDNLVRENSVNIIAVNYYQNTLESVLPLLVTSTI